MEKKDWNTFLGNIDCFDAIDPVLPLVSAKVSALSLGKTGSMETRGFAETVLQRLFCRDKQQKQNAIQNVQTQIKIENIELTL